MRESVLNLRNNFVMRQRMFTYIQILIVLKTSLYPELCTIKKFDLAILIRSSQQYLIAIFRICERALVPTFILFSFVFVGPSSSSLPSGRRRRRQTIVYTKPNFSHIRTRKLVRKREK